MIRRSLCLFPISALLVLSACGPEEGGLTEAEAAVTVIPQFPNYLVYSFSGGVIRVRALTTSPTEVTLPISGSLPVMSPDHAKIAYVNNRRVMVANADGSSPRAISGIGYTSPAWSPDSRSLTYASEGDGATGRHANIYLRAVDLSTPQRQLTDSPPDLYFLSPKFLNDALIVFDLLGHGNPEFPVVSVSASMATSFTLMGGMNFANATHLDPSPSGVEVVYEAIPNPYVNLLCGGGSHAIVVAAVDYDSAGLPTATNHRLLYCDHLLSASAPSWGYYGKIAFTRANGDGTKSAMTIGSSGASPPVSQFSLAASVLLDLSIR
ncbi:MAG: hypothetical protein U1E65_30175 [Myxococcota bacterium]